MFWTRTPLLFDQLFRDVIWRMPATGQSVYITFDDGPHPQTTPFILEQLAAHEMQATFFLLGRQVEAHPELYQAIIDEGHLVAHHTYSHVNGWHTGLEEYLEDVSRGATQIPSNYFRPPYGKLTKAQWTRVREQFRIVMWSVMPEDWRTELDSEKVLHRLTEKTRSGDIVLLHENDKSMHHIRKVLPKYLSFLQANNLTSNRLDHAD